MSLQYCFEQDHVKATLARYEGWSGEYWIDPTAKEWIDHCIDLAAIAKIEEMLT